MANGLNNREIDDAYKAFQAVGQIIFLAIARFFIGIVFTGKGSSPTGPGENAETEECVTQKEACQYLKVSPTTLRRLEKEHDFGKSQVGRRPRYSRKKLEAYFRRITRRKE